MKVRQQITFFFDHSQPDVFYNTADGQLVILV